MPQLMKQVTNGYTTYFNDKYKRVGSLLGGRYKSVLIESEYLLLQIVRFVHVNPSIAGLCVEPGEYAWSSYTRPLQANQLINRFGSIEQWETFHLDRRSYEAALPKLRHLTID